MGHDDPEGKRPETPPLTASVAKGEAPEADLGEGALIYGREGCPHTRRARAALPRARFVDVQAEAAALEEMLRFSGGVRRVPVILRPGPGGSPLVEVGFRRGA